MSRVIGIAGTATELISSRNCEHFLRGALSLLPPQDFVVGVARPPATTASTSWIGCRAGHRASAVRRLTRQSQALVLVLRAPLEAFSPANTRSEPCRMAERRT